MGDGGFALHDCMHHAGDMRRTHGQAGGRTGIRARWRLRDALADFLRLLLGRVARVGDLERGALDRAVHRSLGRGNARRRQGGGRPGRRCGALHLPGSGDGAHQLKRMRTLLLRPVTRSLALTLTRPLKPAGRVTVTAIAAAPGPVVAGVTVTPATTAAGSRAQSTVRPPGSALSDTTVLKVPAGTSAGVASILFRATRATGTTPSIRRLGKMLSAPRTLKLPARVPACKVA